MLDSGCLNTPISYLVVSKSLGLPGPLAYGNCESIGVLQTSLSSVTGLSHSIKV